MPSNWTEILRSKKQCDEQVLACIRVRRRRCLIRGLKKRTRVLLTEATPDGWGLWEHAHANDELIGAASAEIATLRADLIPSWSTTRLNRKRRSCLKPSTHCSTNATTLPRSASGPNSYIQHSAHIPPGRDGLLTLVRGLPDTLRYENRLILAEGDYVIAHGRFSGTAVQAWIAADVVRFEDGKLAEHWDVLQDEATQAKSVSGLPMFGDCFPD